MCISTLVFIGLANKGSIRITVIVNLCVLAEVNNLCYLKLQEESEVPDDETINQMIARSEEEFEIYQVRTWSSKICCFSLSLM